MRTERGNPVVFFDGLSNARKRDYDVFVAYANTSKDKNPEKIKELATETLQNFASWSLEELNSHLSKARTEAIKERLKQHHSFAIKFLKDKIEDWEGWPKQFKLDLPSDLQQDPAKNS